jgi:hypothetical protein
VTVTIGFSTTDKLASRLIRAWTRSKVSHAWVVVPLLEQPFVIGAEWQGFIAMPYDKFVKQNKVLHEHQYEVPMAHVIELLTWLSTPYDFLAILKHVLRPLFSWRKATPQYLMCAEAVCRFAPELFVGIDPEWATPELLMNSLLAQSG